LKRILALRTLAVRYISRIFISMLLVIALLLLPSLAATSGSKGRVAGNVKSASGIPLRDAFIKIFQEASRGEVLSIAGLHSNGRGLFKAANLTPGTYYLQVTHQGYQPMTTEKFEIESDRTTSLDIILRDFIEYLSNDDDPRNWDLKTAIRSSSDRRLIFRNSAGAVVADNGEGSYPFYRSGTMKLASNTLSDGELYLVSPQTSQSGVATNFAFTEPLSPRSRMILSGQLDFGNSSFWRIRDDFNYRPDRDHDYRVSVGYGQMNVNSPGGGSLSPQLFSQEQGSRESGIQTLAFGLGADTRFFDLLTIKYALDYSRLHYGADKSFFYPSLEILFTPSGGWCLKTLFTSRRASDANSVTLPDGDPIDLSEPTMITMVGDHVSMSRVTHSEISVQKSIAPDTAVEFSVYQDSAQGSGLPLVVTMITPTKRTSKAVPLNGNISSQRGMRLTINRRLFDFLNSSLAYVYGTASSVSYLDEFQPGDRLSEDLLRHVRQGFHHAITGQLDATVPITKTNLMATVRWYPGNPLTPIDWFSDRMDIGTKSVNFEIRQTIPMPDFLGNTGRWEVLVDLRNMLNQGSATVPVSDGDLVLSRNPRSLRFGLNLNFR
jgi:hypothetical protein